MDGVPVPTESRDRTVWMFWLFALLHLAVWTALPLALYSALPMDSMEMHVWGQQWQLGYHKHPPLPAWIARAATVATGGSVAGIFLASQVCVVASFWAAWRMGRALVSPQAALLGVMLLEGCLFFNYETTILNNNTVLYAFWALATLFLFQALETDRLRDWLALGICGGLGMLTKYTFGMLPAVMLVFLVLHPQARRVWKRPGPYLAALVAVAVFSPHVYWAYLNDFPPLHWAAERAQHESGAAGRLTNPLAFSLSQLMALLPVLLACVPLAGWKWSLRPLAGVERFRRDYLATMVLGLFALHLFLSLAFNLKLRSIWGSFLWTFVGVLLLYSLKLRLEARQVRRAFVLCTVLALLFVGARLVRIGGSGLAGRSPRELFDSRALARQVEEVWQRQSDEPLRVIVGEGWLAGTASFYGERHAIVYGLAGESVPPNDRRLVPWLDDRQLGACGGVFLWNLGEKNADETLAKMQSRFPDLRPAATLEIPFTHSSAPPARIAVAIIPPAGSVRQASRPQ